MIIKRIGFALVAGVVLCGCGGPVNNNAKDAAQLSQDSTALVAILNKEIKIGGEAIAPIPTEITEFGNSTCRLRVLLPEDRRGAGAQSLGVEKCTAAVQWLNENGYDLGLSGIYVSCYVYSPHKGTTGREDMLVQWGRARYDTNADSVEWTPAK